MLLWLLGVGVVFSSVGLVILVRARDGGASSPELGAMFAITAAGGVVGAIAAPAVVRRAAPRRVIVLFAWLATAASLGLVATESPWVLGVLGATAFLLFPSVNAIAFGTVSQEADEAMQGRATSGAIQLATLGAPVGPLLAGVLIGAVGTSATLLGYGCALAVLAIIATSSRALRTG